MTVPPLPESNVVRVRLDYQDTNTLRAGNRMFIGYSGTPPTGANCVTLATDIVTAWEANLQSIFSSNLELLEVDVLDLSSYSGLSGQSTATAVGSRGSGYPPIQVAMGIEFGLSRRYRGGKPRIYLPAGVEGDMANAAQWSDAFVTECQTKFAAFITAIEALSIGAMGTLNHVNVSYYQGYRTRTTGGGQTTFAPKYRTPNALVDNVTGYFAKKELSSQRRRRTATTF